MADDEGNESSDAYCSSDEEDLSYVDFHTEVDDNVVTKTVTTNDPFLNKLCSDSGRCVRYDSIEKRKKKELGDDESLKVKKVTTRSRSKTDEAEICLEALLYNTTAQDTRERPLNVSSGECCPESPKWTKAKVKGDRVTPVCGFRLGSRGDRSGFGGMGEESATIGESSATMRGQSNDGMGESGRAGERSQRGRGRDQIGFYNTAKQKRYGSYVWDVNAVTGRYLSTYFVICDAKPNKDEFRIFKNAPFIVELDGETSVRKAFMKSDGFIRYPFELVELKNLEVTNNKYLIGKGIQDVVGYVTNVERSVQKRSGLRTLDLYLANSMGQVLRVTLWGGLGEKLIEKRTCHARLYPIVLNSLSVNLYNNRLYLSSSSFALIIDDDSIPALKQMKTNKSCVETGKETLPVDFSEAKASTLKNLLMWGATEGTILELEVSDNTAEVVVVMFDETATSLVKCSADSILKAEDQAHSYYEHDTYESFTCWKIVFAEEVGESKGSGTVEPPPKGQAPLVIRSSNQPSVATPSKPTEEKKHKRVELEDSDAECSFVAKTQSGTVDGGSKTEVSYSAANMRTLGADVSYYSLGPPSYESSHCHASMWYEERSNKARKAVNPSFSLCYQNSKVRLSKFKPTPQPLHNLLNYNGPATGRFRDQIRVYNSMFSFISFGARIDHSINISRGLYTFRINGQNYHIIGSLLLKEGAQEGAQPSNSGARKTNCGFVTIKEYYSYTIHHRKDQVLVVYVIEFQKRGLPYAHLLLWLEADCKCKTTAQKDHIIPVELPSLTDDPERYKVVTEYMLHGPCGNEGRYAPCTIEGKCTKRYPKAFYVETILDDDGYPIYRRQDNKACTRKGKFTFDNRHVVPYNRYLLMKYHAHIKVEWCNRSNALKYLFKYLSKGPDRAIVVIKENV
uniref:Helicase n=1 Tax=Tanacetum cinerariifolium TaxID=118510 RepID=A0A6L2LZJ5_TANCI|nr:helicase [Tanacetum cinerariifolium]